MILFKWVILLYQIIKPLKHVLKAFASHLSCSHGYVILTWTKWPEVCHGQKCDQNYQLLSLYIMVKIIYYISLLYSVRPLQQECWCLRKQSINHSRNTRLLNGKLILVQTRMLSPTLWSLQRGDQAIIEAINPKWTI